MLLFATSVGEWDSVHLQPGVLHTVPTRITRVTLGTAVLMIWAANSLRKRAATPISRRKTATGVSRLATGLIIALNIAKVRAWSWSALGSDFFVPRNHSTSLDAGHLAHITLIASWTTVISILATYSLRHGTAIPVSIYVLTASVGFRTRVTGVTALILM